MGLIKNLLNMVKEIRGSVKKYSEYKSMTNEELLALSDDDLYNAVSSITDLDVGSLAGKDIAKMNEYQRTFYVLNEFNNEIMNGGLCQFFVNSSREYAPFVSQSLLFVGADKTKALFDDFVLTNQINLDDLNSFIIQDVNDFEKQNERYPFDDFDDEYVEIDELYDLMIKYARENIEMIINR